MNPRPRPETGPALGMWGPALIACAASLAYSGSVTHGFVWDDHALIENQEFLQHPGNLRVLMRPSFYRSQRPTERYREEVPPPRSVGARPIQGAARPVVLASLLVDRALWGANPAGFHLTNVRLHVLASLGVFLLAAFLWPAGPGALIAGLLFALHPIHAEAVNLVSFRSDLLSADFCLAGLCCFLWARRRVDSRETGGLVVLSAVCYLLGLLSKEMAATMPCLAWLFDSILDSSGRPPAAGRWGSWRAVALALYLLAAGFYLHFHSTRFVYRGIHPRENAARSAVEPAGPGVSTRSLDPSPPQWARMYRDPWIGFMTMSGVFADYFRWLVVPYPSRVDRAPVIIDSARDGRVWAAWILLAALAWAALRRRTRQRHPAAALGAAWCFITLLPVANIVPLYNPVAERYLYLVSVGACLAAAEGFIALGGIRRQAGLAAVALACFLAMTAARTRDWGDELSLFAKEIGRAPENSRVLYNVAWLEQQQGRTGEAERHYRRALELHPAYAEAMVNLAGLRHIAGDDAEGLSLARRAVELEPGNPVALDALGNFVAIARGTAAAVEWYKKAVAADPNLLLSRLHLASAEAELRPADPSAWDRLAGAWRDRGDMDKAIECIRRGLAMAPRDRVLREHFGDMLLITGDRAAAAGQFESALRGYAEDDSAAAPLRAKLEIWRRERGKDAEMRKP